MPFRQPLPTPSKFTLGTGNLRDKSNKEHIALIRAAMDAGVWFHSAAEYAEGTVFETLRAAFREDPQRVPKFIFKIKSFSPEVFKSSVEDAIQKTGAPRVDIAQICWYMPEADRDLRPGCGLHDAICEMQRQGKVGSCVLEFFRQYVKPTAYQIVEEELFDGYIYYHNVVDREVPNSMYDLLLKKKAPVLALRTVGGGAGDLASTPRAEADATCRKLADWTARAGCASEIELRLRFPLSYPQNLTTIGATTKLKNLNAFLELNRNPRPLPAEVIREIDAEHRRWFAE